MCYEYVYVLIVYWCVLYDVIQVLIMIQKKLNKEEKKKTMNFKWVVKIFHGLLRSTGEKKKKEMSWVQSVQAVVTVLGWVASVL